MDHREPDASQQVSPSMIVLARESRGLTQSAVASRMNVSQARLSKVESGLAVPDHELVVGLSAVLGYPEGFFFQPDKVLGPGTSEFFHRKRKTLSAKLLRKVHAGINIRIMHVSRLLRSVDIGEDHIPRMDPDEYGSADEVARAVRAAWQMPAGPVPNVVEAIENAGGIVVKCDFGTPLIDALSRDIPGLPRMFFVNSVLPPDRQRLTLAHELGHAVMHQVPHPEMEDQAFGFGAEFLMPASDIRRQLDRVDLARLADLKPYWKISMAALLMRARELGKVSPRMERHLWMQMGQSGLRTREPDMGIEVEEPRLLSEIVSLYQNELGYGLEDMSAMLLLSEDEVQSVYGVASDGSGAGPRLRLVT